MDSPVGVIMTPIVRFMGRTWGPSGANRTQVDPMLAPWTLPSGDSKVIVTIFDSFALMWVHISSSMYSIWLQFSKLRYTYAQCNSQGLWHSKEVFIFGRNWWDIARDHTFSLLCYWSHVCPWLAPDTHPVLCVVTHFPSHDKRCISHLLKFAATSSKSNCPNIFSGNIAEYSLSFLSWFRYIPHLLTTKKSQTLCNTVNSGLIWFIHFVRIEFFPAPNMADFYVLGSDVGFPTSPPGSLKGHAGYKLCGQYPGTPPVGQISRVTCEPGPTPAKYVYIQADVPAGIMIFLELCEVWVYGSKFSKIRHYGYNSYLCIYII